VAKRSFLEICQSFSAESFGVAINVAKEVGNVGGQFHLVLSSNGQKTCVTESSLVDLCVIGFLEEVLELEKIAFAAEFASELASHYFM